MTQQPYERVLFCEGDSVEAKRENLLQAYVLKALLTSYGYTHAEIQPLKRTVSSK